MKTVAGVDAEGPTRGRAPVHWAAMVRNGTEQHEELVVVVWADPVP